HRDLGGDRLQFMEIVGRELQIHGSQILFEPLDLGSARDGNNPWLLCEQPGECNLCRSRSLLLREPANHVDQSLICFAVLRCKAGHVVEEIILLELRVFADFSGEKASAERAEGNESDSEFLESWKDFSFGLSPPKRIFILQGRDRLDSVRTANSVQPCFR